MSAPDRGCHHRMLHGSRGHAALAVILEVSAEIRPDVSLAVANSARATARPRLANLVTSMRRLVWLELRPQPA